ncbi:hypothetical protein HK100_010678 [Physocladia obscura]|uniref:Uncharacterized protein n=1 Tax=Physocladia obscura TaxID=109957 RepID=A0AAD5T3Z7_9FUNG|nr:hypothetical protein HK100_010678 [Physocladia obscura]
MNGMTTTWNGAASHATTGSALLDLFYAASRGIEEARLATLAAEAYKEDPLVRIATAKIAAYVRDVRGGKGERSVGRMLLAWLAVHDPALAIHNLPLFANTYGRFDDVLAVLPPVEKIKEATTSTTSNSPVAAAVYNLWASQLETDLAELSKNPNSAKISLAAKWIPSENKAGDKKYGITKNLTRALSLKNNSELRKVYLTPLRKRLALLESFMCAKDWDAIQFQNVPSVAMKIHGGKNKVFEKRTGERFTAYKEGLSKGTTKVNAKDLFPHEIVNQYIGYGASVNELLEAQWRIILEKGSELGDLSSVLVMSDVSSSMRGLPMQISIALGVLVSQLTSAEWKGLVMTFEATPRFHLVQGKTLKEQVDCLAKAPWGGNTNFLAALDLILATATKNKLAADAMPKKLIVISDMQFDSANGSAQGTNYDALMARYIAAGYKVPHLVFWNVNGSTSDYPTTNVMPNVSLISGYSPAVLKAVLKGVEITPYLTMMNALSDARYELITLPPVEEDTEISEAQHDGDVSGGSGGRGGLAAVEKEVQKIAII